MAVSDDHVARALKEIEQGSDHPQHLASLVGAFIRRQTTIGHYMQSHASELSMEGVVLTLLHASVMVRCVELARGHALRVVSASELDRAAKKNIPMLSGEDALESYLASNITEDDPTIGGKRRSVALNLLRLVTTAALDQ